MGRENIYLTTSLAAVCSFPPNCRHLKWPTRIYPTRGSPQRRLYKIKYVPLKDQSLLFERFEMAVYLYTSVLTEQKDISVDSADCKYYCV